MRGKVKFFLNEWLFIHKKEVRTEWGDKSISSSKQIDEIFKVNEVYTSLCKEGLEFEGVLDCDNTVVISPIIGKCSHIKYFNISGIPIEKNFVDIIESGKFGDFQKSTTYDFNTK